MNYWHMQIHPDDEKFSKKYLYKILEHKKIIGLGDWERGGKVIQKFKEEMQVNDIVAIKDGSILIALVQVIGGAYKIVDDDNKMTNWIAYRRPIRVLDWEIEDKTLPQPRGTLTKCVSQNAPTTKIIKDWHKRVEKSFKKRDIPLTV